MARRVSAARIKSHRSYTVEELAETVGKAPQTIRAWIKRGLPVLTAQRPFLILGSAAKEFLAATEQRRKRPLRMGEFFCMRCKVQRSAALGIAAYHPRTMTSGRLEAFCDNCESTCTRIIRAQDLPAWREIYEIDGNAERQA